jgi:signal transduction histidine kinase
MKSDSTFLLENAGWPAFLVEASGVIRRANQAAIALFGPKLEGETVSLSAIWANSPENAEQFLARWERSPASIVPMQYSVKGGAVAQYATHVCSTREASRRYVFQLLAQQPIGPGGSASSGTTTLLAASPVSVPAGAPAAALPKAATLADLERLSSPRSRDHDTVVVHKQKLDCALHLARTVALDFNNALTTILGHTSLLLSVAERDHPWRGSLVEVEKATHRAAEITHQLAAFSRPEKETDNRPAGNINALLRRVVEIFQQARPARVSWWFQLEPQLYSPRFDEAKLQQVFNKIIENSLEALAANATPAHGSSSSLAPSAAQAPMPTGRIAIATWNFETAEPVQDGIVQLSPGSYVCVEISDDGPGIDAAVLPRIFEPFFTTKEGHRGLGLAWVYGIVTNHSGGVTIFSQPGQGTMTRIYLPATRKLIADAGVPQEQLRGTQTILMVDDEDLLLTMGQVVLGSFGYRVLTANTGRRALEVLEKTTSPVDLVITDLAMPQMSGHELIEQIQLRRPGVPLLCTSGFARGPEAADNQSFLAKPFTSHDLLMRVRQLLQPRDDAQSA